MSYVPKRGTQTVLKLKKKITKNKNKNFLKGAGNLGSIFDRFLRLEWAIALDFLGSYSLTRCILILIFNILNLIIPSRSHRDHGVNLEEEKSMS